jgi:hypothetical protein
MGSAQGKKRTKWEAVQIKWKANHKKWMAKMEADQRETEALFKMMDKRNAHQEEWKAGMMPCLEKMEARMGTGQEEYSTKIKTDQEEREREQ